MDTIPIKSWWLDPLSVLLATVRISMDNIKDNFCILIGEKLWLAVYFFLN